MSPDLVAALALLVAVISLLISIIAIREQRRQWRATSLGRVEMTDASFVYWRTLPELDLKTIKWGYEIDAMPLIEGNKVTGQFGVPSILIAVDPVSGKELPGIQALTLDEFAERVRRSPGNPQGVLPAKKFQIDWTFQNLGGSVVTQLRLAIDNKLPDTGVWETGTWSQPCDLAPGRSVHKLSPLTAPLSAHLPERLSFRVRMGYTDIEGTGARQVVPVYFHSPSGAFNFGD